MHSVFKIRTFVLNNFTVKADDKYIDLYFNNLTVQDTKLSNPYLKPELMFNLAKEIDLTSSKRKKIREEIFNKKAEYLKLKNEIDEFSKNSNQANPKYVELVSQYTGHEWESFAISMQTRKLETELKRLKMQRASDDLNFRDIQDNCKILETKIFPKVEDHSKLIKDLFHELSTIKKEIEDLPEVFKKEKLANEKFEGERDEAITQKSEAMSLIEEQRKELVEIESNFNKKEKISGMALHNSNELKERIDALKGQVVHMTDQNTKQKAQIDNFDSETVEMHKKLESLKEENTRLKRRQSELGEQKLTIFMNIKGRMQENELLREIKPYKLEQR